MKYLKYFLLALLPLVGFAQTTPINNPTLTGIVTINSTPTITSNIAYVNGSNRLVPLTIGAGLNLSGGVLTTNNGGSGGSGVSQIIAGNGITISPSGGTGTVTINSYGGGVAGIQGFPSEIYVNGTAGSYVTGNVILTLPQPIGTANTVQFNQIGIGGATVLGSGASVTGTYAASSGLFSNPAVGIYDQPTLVMNANSEVMTGAFIQPNLSIGGYTGLTYYGLDLANVSGGSTNITNAYQIYIGSAPTATNKYGIYQSGSDTNVLNNLKLTPSGGGGITFADGTVQTTAASGGGGGGGGITAVFGTTGQINAVTTSNQATVSLATTGVSSGTYTNSTVTVDSYGRVTSASNGSTGAPVNNPTFTGTVTMPDTSYFSSSVAVFNSTTYLNGTSYLPLATFVGSGSSPAITFADTSTLTSSGFTFNKIAQFNASSGYVANFSGSTYFNNNQYYNPSLFTSTSGGILGVNGATGKVSPVTLTGLTWNGTTTLSLSPISGVYGSYTNANITIDAYGRITAASNGSGGGGGGVSSVSLAMPSGFSVSGSPVTSSGTLTVSTSLSGMLYGTGSGFTVATAGTNYTSPSGSENLSNKTISSSSIGTTYIANSHLDSTPIGATTPSTGVFSSLSSNGNINASGGYINLTSPTGAPSTSGQGQLGAYPTFGLELIGNGTTSDIVLLNRVGGTALSVPANTTLIKLSVYTVSTLPSASGNAAAECFVSDSNAPNGTGYGTTVVGGGGYLRKVFCDGYNWILE